ncbi:MAG: hypothetical protein WC378_13415, partial [Opitutaceae bacterium]
MNKKISAILAAGAVVLIVGFFLLRSRNATLAPQAANLPPTAVTIAQAGDFYLYAPLYVALDRGFFKQYGLEVT